MNTLNSYEQAISVAHKDSHLHVFPLVSLEFYSDAFTETKQNCIDSSRLIQLSLQNKWKNFDYNLLEKLQQFVILLTTPNLEIIFASNQLTKMNGYQEFEVLGKTPKIFQGEATSLKVLQEIREAVNSHMPFEKTILNYKKDGSTYKCLISGIPLFNSKGKLSHFIAFEKTV